MYSKIKIFFLLGIASTLTFSGSALIGLSLAIDTWRVCSQLENNKSVTYYQGILNECKVYGKQPKQCYSWKESHSVKELFEYQELLLSFIASSCAVGGLSILFSIVATTSRIAKHVIPVTACELTSALLGAASLVIYTIKYIKKPCTPSFSYFSLWGGTLFVLFGLVVHTCVGDVKFFGRKFFVKPYPNYRYHKGTNTLVKLL